MDNRRTNPSFLSNDEAARDSRRTAEAVKSIVGISPINSNVRCNIGRHYLGIYGKKQDLGKIRDSEKARVASVDVYYQSRILK